MRGVNRTDIIDTWVCPDCGHTHEGNEPPTEDCPICGAPAEDYEKEE